MNYDILEKINQLDLINEYKKLESKITWLKDNNGNRQCGVQYKHNEDHFLSAVGKLKTEADEREYNFLNPLFKGTIFEELIDKFNLCRSRLMWAAQKTCYSLHRDPSKRLHVPIMTNENCYFLFPGPDIELIHLKAGFIYNVDTTKIHSFCNFSNFSRLHFLGCVYH